MLSVEMIVSRAANDEINPTPIFQSNPSGLIAGSMNRPARPAKLFCTWTLAASGAFEAVRGKAANAQSKIEIASITVPARFRKIEQRVNSAWPTLPRSGRRYGGNSITNGGDGAFSKVCLRIQAMTIATIIPVTYIARIKTAPREIMPRNLLPEKKAAITRVYTGSRAEQLMNGATRIVATRSFGFSIVR